MEAIVLAGGYATRMWPVTREIPKVLLPLGDDLVIDPLIRDLEEEVDKIWVSTNSRFESQFEEWKEARDFDVEITTEPTTEEDEKLGVIRGISETIKREDVDDDLLVVGGDNLMSMDIGDFLDSHSGVSLAAYDIGNREDASGYGVLSEEDGELVEFLEKPENPKSSLVSLACYAFDQEYLDVFDTYLSEGNNPDEPGWLIQWMLNRQSINVFSFEGEWFDVGTLGSYIDAISWYSDEPYIEGRTINSRVTGDSVILPGSEIRDSVVHSSVVLPGGVIENSHLSRSLIGKGAKVESRDKDLEIVQ